MVKTELTVDYFGRLDNAPGKKASRSEGARFAGQGEGNTVSSRIVFHTLSLNRELKNSPSLAAFSLSPKPPIAVDLAARSACHE